MASAAVTTDTGLNLSASYTYEDDLLTKIQTASTTYNFTYGNFGLRSSVKVGTQALATYSYTQDGNNYLSSLDYGNGDKVQYEYDSLGRVTKQTYEDGDTVTYQYDNSGALATVTDSATGRKTTYYYDFTDRLMKYVETGSNYYHSVGYEYDQLNNLTSLVETINGIDYTTSYVYDDDNRVTSVTTNGTTVEYTYDAYGRISSQITASGDTQIKTDTFSFKNPSETATSAQIAEYTVTSSGFSNTYAYDYDDNGNIQRITDSFGVTEYTYDSANQLIREDNEQLGFTYVWTYDSAGNILSRTEYAYTPGSLTDVTPVDTITYTYGNSEWGDLLTAYDGTAITYDEIGNPLSDGTWTYTWEHGRELVSMSNGSASWNFTYDSNGLRTMRTYGMLTYEYVYNGSQLTEMVIANLISRTVNTLHFSYDANGTPTTVTYNGYTYYYVTNIQGDVVAILNSSGTAVVTYAYDAWGNILSTGGSMASSLGATNPLRYRGYVYDEETDLYYLQSRYYDPALGRFINADNYPSTGQGLLGNNMFAYCGNNPVNRVDYTGQFWAWIVQIVGSIKTVVEIKNWTQKKKAKEEYNAKTVEVYWRGSSNVEEKTVNAEMYSPSMGITNIHISNSLDIRTKAEQNAVLDVIMDSPYYYESTFGSKSFMRAQWAAHNVCHQIASSGNVGFKVMQTLSGSENPIESSVGLDLRSTNNMLRRQKIIYTIISWFY